MTTHTQAHPFAARFGARARDNSGHPRPIGASWREHALTRAAEIETLVEIFVAQAQYEAERESAGQHPNPVPGTVGAAARAHVAQARFAAGEGGGFRSWLNGSAIERSVTNLDAAESDSLRLAPDSYLRGQMPTLLAHVRQHLPANDPRRARIEELSKSARERALTADERDAVITAQHGASSAARREILRVRSFRNVLFSSAAALTLVVLALVTVGVLFPTALPLCFSQDSKVICPTAQITLATPTTVGATGTGGTTTTEPSARDVDSAIRELVTSWDTALVLLVGAVAAAVAAAATLRNLRGTSTPYSLPVALAVVKLPTGALTAFLGLLLMRGEFIPGLSALDFPAQIIAWAVVFGYGQQLFTRLVDQQAHQVMNDVGGRTDRPSTAG